MSVLKYFKNIPGRPPKGRQALSVIFFKFATRSLEKKGGLSPPPGDRGMPPYISSNPPFPPHLSPKIPPKIQKKREE